ncbi:MAG: hypothetical protein IKS03_00380 [Ruminococcus sp.]|nr:hypothetical protein [Ruminococcus sp.]
MKKEIMISALLALTIGITAACGSEKESSTDVSQNSKGGAVELLDNADTSAAGKYELTAYEKDGSAEDISGKKSTIELREDGTGTFTVNGSPAEFT